MTSLELYYEFQLILNKNASLENVNISKGNFVILYNREVLLWLNDFILKNNSSNRILGIQGLLKVNNKLSLKQKEDRYYSFALPEDYFDFVDCYSDVEKDGCIRSIPNYLEKPKEIQSVLVNVIPSFKYEEGLCNIAQEKVIVFMGDYKINNTYLSYYQKPQKIDLDGYRKISGKYSTNIDSSLDDLYQSEVLNRMVIEVMRQFENGNGYKLSSDREVV